MDNNAWKKITPNDYDEHMSHPNVAQTQMLNSIIKEQFELLSNEQTFGSCAAILGITNGNGLEHVITCDISKIIGIDINKSFLDECRMRFNYLEQRLHLYQLDLTIDTIKSIQILSKCDLIIANLLIKHIHLVNFEKIIAGLPKRHRIISCVIQVNPDGVAVSHSGFEHIFEKIAQLREEENEDLIIQSMKQNGYMLSNRITYGLPNGKIFIRLDFSI